MNWEVCKDPLPSNCLSINDLLKDNEDIRLTERFPLNNFETAYLSILTSKDLSDVEVNVLLTKSHIEGEENDVFQLSIWGTNKDAPIHIVHSFNEDIFVPKSRVVFKTTSAFGKDLEVELTPVRKT